MAELEEITRGDTMTDIGLDIVNPDGTAKDITGFTVRAFLEGVDSGDRPASSGGKVTSAATSSTTIGAKNATRASGSYVSDNFVVGMLIVSSAFPEGTVCTSVAALTLGTDQPAIEAHTADLAVTGWFGILCQITAGPSGAAAIVGAGQYLDFGPLASDVYEGKARMLDGSNSEVGWTNSARGVVRFKAVQP